MNPRLQADGATPQGLRILCYTCGSHAIGMGNVMRVLAIAQAFSETSEPVETIFAVQEFGEASRQIEASGYPIVSWESSRVVEPDVVIVDVPHAEPQLFEEWSARRALTVCIDDPGPARYAADLAFTMLYAPALVRPPGCTTEEFGEFGRFDYCPLRREFSDRPKKKIHEQGGRLLIVHGGSDRHGITMRLCQALLQVERAFEVDVVMGPAFRHEAALRQLVQQDARFHGHRQPPMLSLMEAADVAISAAGVTALELAAVGVPMLLLVSQPREVQTAAALERGGAAIYLGHSDEVSDARVSSALLSLLDHPTQRRALSLHGQALIDGHGAQRLAQLILARGLARLQSNGEERRRAAHAVSRRVNDRVNSPSSGGA